MANTNTEIKMKKTISILLAVLMLTVMLPAGLNAETSNAEPADNAGVTLCGFANWENSNGDSTITFNRTFVGFNSENPNATEDLLSLSGKDSDASAAIGDTVYFFAHTYEDDTDQDSPEIFYRVDTTASTWTATQIGTGSTEYRVASLTYAQDTDTLYALILRKDRTNQQLMIVNRENGSMTEVFDLAEHDLAIIPTIAYIGNGQFFAVHHATGKALIFNTSGQIVRTMQAITANTAVESFGGLYYYAPGNVIYGALEQKIPAGSFGILVSIDPATGVVTEKGSIGYSYGYAMVGLFALENHTITPTPHPTQEEFDAALNASGSSLTFVNDRVHPWNIVTGSGRTYVESTIQGMNGASSSITATYNGLTAGQVLSFDWSVSSENNYDWMTFAVNGTTVQRISGSHSFASYSYSIPSNGMYTFTWTYSKDSSAANGSDSACLDNIAISGNQPQPIEGNMLNTALNAPGSNIDFSDDPSHPWAIDSSESGRVSIKSTIVGDSEDQVVYFRIRDAHAGDAIRFDWKTDCEYMFDQLQFRKNNAIIEFISGDSDWAQYTYVIPEDGDYFFSWDFSKDDDDDSSYRTDRGTYEDGNGWVDNIEYIRDYGFGGGPSPDLPNPASFNSAVNAPGENRSFENDPVIPWQIANDSGRTCAVSNIMNMDNTETEFTIDMGYLEAGTTISFDWKTDTEAGHDRVSVTLNGCEYKVASGQTAWTSESVTVLSSDYYVIGWKYSKNYTASSYSDKVWVDNIKITPVVTLTYHTVTIMDGFDNTVLRTLNVPDGHYVVCPDPPVHIGYVFDHWEGQIENITSDGVVTAIYLPREGGGLMGDVNGDGVVSITDATAVARHAMNLVLLNSNYVQYADMDGNGIISISDAVIVMRTALGLN